MSVLLSFDTATAATVVGARAGGREADRRDDPAHGGRPAHGAVLLALCRAALAELDVALADVTRIGCGVGPGSFTGLRIGVATARALAQATGAELVPVPTLASLAAATKGRTPCCSVLDARRGEAFVQRFDADGRPEDEPRAVLPDALGAVATGRRAVGDGAVRFRAQLEAAGAEVPPDGSPLHRVGAEALLALAAAGEPVPRAALVPAYVRAPDAVERPRP